MTSARHQRSRHTFWIDDQIVDRYGPIFEQFPFGSTALAIYAVLARRADRDGESWARVKPLARLAATSERPFQRSIRLLELLDLVNVESCFLAGTNIQTSNQYTLLAPPDVPPRVDPDLSSWPPPVRHVVFVTHGASRQRVCDGRPQPSPAALPTPSTGCQADTPPGVELTPTPRQPDTPPVSGGHPPGVSLTPQEGNTVEGQHREGQHTEGEIISTKSE